MKTLEMDLYFIKAKLLKEYEALKNQGQYPYESQNYRV